MCRKDDIMEYSKQFNYQGITILFDKLERNKQYPTFYMATKNDRVVAYIPIRKIVCNGITRVSDKYSVASFTFYE